MNERKKSVVGWTTAVVVAVAGAVVLIVGLMTPVAFGWFAYQPLANATFVPDAGGVFLSRLAIIGLVILAIGLLAIAFLAGFRAAQGRSSRDAGTSPTN